MSRAMQFDIVANDKATGTMQKAEKSMGTFSQNMVGKFTMMAAKAVLVVAAFTKIMNVIKETGDIADESAKLGLSPETYQRLKFAAEDYGASIENVAMALKDVNKLLDQAATKGGPDKDVLLALGFSQQEIADRAIKAEEVFKRVADAIKEARSEEEKFAIASRIVGDRVAQAMVPILADYENFMKTSKEIGVVSNENAQIADAMATRFDKRMATIKAGITNFFADIGRSLSPELAAPATNTERTQADIDEARRKRDALLASSARSAAPRESGMAVTSLQQIGGGVARGQSALEDYAARTAVATETIAATATESAPATTGATDITKEPEGRPFLDQPKQSTRKFHRIGPFTFNFSK